MVARMSRSALLACAAAAAVALGACGPKVPQHPGYKSKTAEPWKKAKAVKLKNGAGEVEGALDYAKYRRSRWHAVDLPGDGELTVTLAQHGGGDGKTDVAYEIVDSVSYKVLAKADREDEDAFEEEKLRTASDLRRGRYLVHVYLQGRLDTAEYELKVKYDAKALAESGPIATNLAFPPELPVVPIDDDTPVVKKPRGGGGGSRPRDPQPDKPDSDKPSGPTLSGPVAGRVINVQTRDGGVEITINRGTDHGLADGAKGRVDAVKNSDFTLTSCGNRSCKAFVRATADQVGGKGVTVGP
jgi:hypothetical protein